MGEKLPIDTNQQLEYFSKSKKYKIYIDVYNKTLFRGDIVFWEGHIAVVVDNKNLIHASAYHGKVVVENIKKTIKRINQKTFFIIEKKL